MDTNTPVIPKQIFDDPDLIMPVGHVPCFVRDGLFDNPFGATIVQELG